MSYRHQYVDYLLLFSFVMVLFVLAIWTTAPSDQACAVQPLGTIEVCVTP